MRARQEGQALISVLGLLFVLTLIAWAFVSLMHAEQRLAGSAYRSAAALYLAEAGAEKALWSLANRAPDGSREEGWGLVGYQEELGAGRFVVEEVREQSPGMIAVTVRGEVGGTVRRIRRTARIVPKALGFGLFGGQVVLVGRARTYVVPILRSQEACQRLGDIAVSRQLWLDAEVSLNALDGRKVGLRDEAVLDYLLFGLSSRPDRSDLHNVLPDLVLTASAEMILGNKQWPVGDLSALRHEVPGAYVRTLRTEEVSAPSVDLETYRSLARENRANVAINKIVGERALDRVLTEKEDSLYSPEQFERIVAYLDAQRRGGQDGKVPALNGLVYVEGMVNISRRLLIEDGGLVVRGTLRVMDGARLEVRHGPKARSLPGVIAFGDGGTIRLGRDAVVIVDGLLLASTGLEVFKASVDVSGAILTGQGFLNDDGFVVVRYHPDVLGTVGLKRTEQSLVRAGSWQELP